MSKERLVTSSYCYILSANFLLFFGFYLLMPVLPFYLTEEFGTGSGMAGAVLSCYTIAALSVRPFSGYLLDTFARKPLYLLAFFVFTSVFAGYLLAGTLTLFTILRVVHGFSFGMVTVARQHGRDRYHALFAPGRGTGVLRTGQQHSDVGRSDGGTVPARRLLVRGDFRLLADLLARWASQWPRWSRRPSGTQVKREPVSLDRFILVKGIPAGVDLLMLSIPYGMTTTYVAMYARQIGITHGMGVFFTLMAVGMAISRIFSGRQVDKGRVTRVIAWGMYLVCLCFFALSSCALLMRLNETLSLWIFFSVALFLGVGFGTMFPAFNTLFVNLAPNNQRGTATSTYLTSWDVGIGIGLLLGGYIAQISTFDKAYLFGACLTVASIVYFQWKVAPHFERNKLR